MLLQNVQVVSFVAHMFHSSGNQHPVEDLQACCWLPPLFWTPGCSTFFIEVSILLRPVSHPRASCYLPRFRPWQHRSWPKMHVIRSVKPLSCPSDAMARRHCVPFCWKTLIICERLVVGNGSCLTLQPLRQCIEAGDTELGYLFTSIFTDLGKSSIELIVDSPEQKSVRTPLALDST